MSILGIDLGTTNSLIAYYNEEGAHIIPNRHGENLTPSVVSVGDEGEIFVGGIARERLITHPDKTVAAFKRSMGSAKAFSLGGKEFLPEELSSFIIRSLVEDAKDYLDLQTEDITEIVISVPAYFNDVQRKATKRAGELAGIKVERLINEPTAASIAYGLQEKREQTKFLVLDLGGGTFDISILELYNDIMEVRGVSGDNYLGGEDFTLVLEKMFLSKFHLDGEAMDPIKKSILKKQAEMAKRKMGHEDESGAVLKLDIDGQTLEMPVSEEDYEEACKSLLQRLKKPIERALSDTSTKISDIDDIILVGGATKLPLIKRYFSRLFRKFPSAHINPDEVVALGASMQAAMKARNQHIKEIILTDVCPYTLGTSIAVQRDSGNYESGHFLPIIERNTIIPVSRTERLYTLYDSQPMITIKILQGESRLSKNNIFLGEVNIPVPMSSKGEEAVDVRYTYDINSILEVEVQVVSTGVKKRVVIEQNPGYMSTDEVEERLRELQSIKIHPRDQEENRLLLARAERMYEENVGETRQYVNNCLKHFEDALHRQDQDAVKKAAELLKEQLDSLEDTWL